MAARRRSRQRGGAMAWLGTLLFGLALTVGGFATGLVLGVGTEEPAVLLGYWSGRSERVAVAAGGSAESPASALTESGGAAASGSRLPAVAAAASGFAVQVGAFSSSEAARSKKARLERDGYPSFVVAAAASRDQRWRVRVGPFPTRDQADRTAGRLERREGLSTWVVGRNDGS